MKVLVFFLVLGIAFSYGAVVPLQNDEVFDFLQSLFAEPDQFASALGFQRVKMDADHDKQFNLEKLGIHAGIKYVDPANRWKGGKAHIVVDNLKKLIPRAKSEKVSVTITMDGGDAPMDGVFNLKIDYVLNHDNEEAGTVTLDRSYDGKFWVSKIKGVSTNNAAVKIIPEFNFELKSDRKTIFQVSHTCAKHDVKINVDRVPGEKMDAVIEYNGKVYIVNGKMDKREKAAKINIDANGQNYVVNIDLDTDGDEKTVKVNVDLGPSGSYQIEGSLTGMEQASLKVDFNTRPLVNIKMKGKVDKQAHSSKFEVRYSAVTVGEGKIRFSLDTQPNQILKLQYLPKKGADFKLEMSREVDGYSRHFNFEAQRGGDIISKYNLDIEPKVAGDLYELDVESQLHISPDSLFYNKFCTYGCFNDRKLEAKLVVEKQTPYKLSLDVDVTKDSDNVFDLSFNTRNNPYTLNVVAPRILPMITDDGRDTFEMEADHNPGQYLKVKSNSPRIKSFIVEKIDGDMRRVELNGKELVRAAFNKGGNQVKQTTKLPDGRSLTTTISWATEELKTNKININLEGTERNFDGYFDWDLSNHDSMWMKMEGKGENKLVGPYELSRDLKINCDHGKHTTISLTGNSKNNDYNVETDINADLDYSNNVYKGVIKKVINGKSYALTLDNGRLSIDV